MADRPPHTLRHLGRAGRGLARRGATAARASCGSRPRVRLHYRFKNRGTEYVSEYGMKWMSGWCEATMRPSPKQAREVRERVGQRRVRRPTGIRPRLGSHPIVTSQYSLTTLYQVSYHILYLLF